MIDRRTRGRAAGATDPGAASANRAVFPLVWAVVFAVTLAGLAGGNVAGVLYELIITTGPLVAWLVAATGIGLLVMQLICVTASRSLRIVTATALGLGVMSLAVLGSGLAGVLNTYTAWMIVAAGVVGSFVSRKQFRSETADGKPASARPNWPLLVLAPLAAFAAVAAFLPPGLLWGDEPNGYDVVEYHLQIPREWYDLGRIVPLTHNAFSYFPQGVEAHYLLAMHLLGGPYAGMYLAQLMHAAFVGLTVMAVYATVLELTAGDRGRAALAAIAAASVPFILLLAPVAYNEGGLLLFGTLALAWLLRRAAAGGELRNGAVAGLMAGFACAVKLTGVPLVLLAVPWAVAVTKRTWRSAAVCVAVGAIAFAPWLVRNQVWAGNPVFPEAAAVLGKAHFSEAQVERWHKAHSPRPDQASAAARVRAFAEQVVVSREFGYLLLPLGVVACAVACRRDRNGRAIAVLLGTTVVFWLGFTHLQGRFFTPAIPLLAIAVGLVNMPQAARWGVAMLLLVGTAVGLAPRFAPPGDRPGFTTLAGVAGVEDFAQLLPAVVKDVPPGRDLVLVGDGKAFLYQGSSQRVHYRTVFDVDVRPSESLVDAWARGFDGAWLVDPGELRRFHTTYFGIPDPGTMPPDPFLVTPPAARADGDAPPLPSTLPAARP